MSIVPPPPSLLAFGPFVLDVKRRSLRAHGQVVRLQPRALAILELLALNSFRVVPRAELMGAVWPGVSVTDANVTVQISNLRSTLAAHGGPDMIVTVGRGYRLVADVAIDPVEPPAPAPVAVPTASADHRPPVGPWWRDRRGVLAAFGGVSLSLAGAWAFLPRAVRPIRLPAHVRVETVPDEVTIAAGGFERVDYVFTVADPVDLQLESEDFQFFLSSGQPVGAGNQGGRILHGSFAIRGGATGVYHNTIYLPPDVALLAQAAGGWVQLRHVFHLRDARGEDVTVPAVLGILVAGPAEIAKR